MPRTVRILESFWPTPNIDPIKLVTAGDWVTLQNMYSTLVELSGPKTVQPGLAEEWSSSNDGLTWQFRLRPNLKWSDGTEMKLEHIVQSLKRSIEQTSHTKLSAYVHDIEARQPDILVFKLKTLPSNFLLNLAFVDQAIVHPSSYGGSSFTWSAPVSGAFRALKVEEREILLEGNKYYWNRSGSQAAIDAAHLIKAVGDLTDIQTLKENSFDAFQTGPGQISSENDLLTLQKDYTILTGNVDFIFLLMFNPKKCKQGLFDQNRRRSWLSWIYEAYWGKSPTDTSRSTGLRPVGMAGSLTHQEFDSIKRQIPPLLDPPQTITFLVQEKHRNRPQIIELKNRLERENIKSEFVIFNKKTNRDELEYDLEIAFLGSSEADPDSVWRYYNNYFFEPMNTDMDLNKAQLEKDTIKRNELYKAFERKAIESAVFIPIRNQITYIITGRNVTLDPKAAVDWGLQLFKLRLK